MGATRPFRPPLTRSYYHRGEGHPLTGCTIMEYLDRVADRFPTRDALVSLPQGTRSTYRQLIERVDEVARGFHALGCRRGDRVGIWSTNNVEWVLTQLATARIGAILVNLNPAYRRHELAHALRRSEIQTVVTIPRFRSSHYVELLTDLVPSLDSSMPGHLQSTEFPHLRQVILYDPLSAGPGPRPRQGITLWSELIDVAARVPVGAWPDIIHGLDADEPINIQYTSGTTGSPKAVVLTHHNILNNALACAEAMRFTEEDRLCVPVPFYHCFGMVVSTLMTFGTGGCLVIPSEHFDPEAVLRAVQSERCTALHGVPTMFIEELELEAFQTFDLTSLRTGIMAGAPCPPALLARVMEDMHCRDILIGYGQTEASPVTHLTSPKDTLARRTQTVGRNLPHQEVKIVHPESGSTVPIGAVGEICFRGYHVMRGYDGDTEATKQAVDDAGWLHSGDLGSMDADGYVTVTGRLKDMIIRGGENIYPREIEDFLFTHPKVAEVAVFGIPDEVYGEAVVAWVQLHAGETATAEEIRDYCRDQIAHFKIPQCIRFVDGFPKTVTGKLQKYRMQEIAVANMPGSRPSTESAR